MNNILITSAGRRVGLVRAFQFELKKVFPQSKVFTADFNPQWSSACRISDSFFTLPKVENDSYINSLLKLCIEESIKVVIPTIDTELEVLSKAKKKFELNNIYIIVSDHLLVSNCRDKRKTNFLFTDLGIKVPNLIEKDNLRFPLFIKPYNGSLSKDIHIINGRNELTDALLENHNLMFMEYIDTNEYQEYTVDAYYDKKNFLKCLVPRSRIEVRGGEISKGRTEKKEFYQILKHKLEFIQGAIGCLTIQVFIGRTTGEIIGIEINPRFGGGYPLSYASGANYPEYIIKEYILNESIPFFDSWIENRVMLRYDSEVILDQNDFIR